MKAMLFNRHGECVTMIYNPYRRGGSRSAFQDTRVTPLCMRVHATGAESQQSASVMLGGNRIAADVGHGQSTIDGISRIPNPCQFSWKMSSWAEQSEGTKQAQQPNLISGYAYESLSPGHLAGRWATWEAFNGRTCHL